MALPFVLLFAWSVSQAQSPQLLIATQPSTIGVLDQNGMQAGTHIAAQDFRFKIWGRSFVPGQGKFNLGHQVQSTWHCDFEGCLLYANRNFSGEGLFSITTSHTALKRDCKQFDFYATNLRLTPRLAEFYGCIAPPLFEAKSMKDEAPISLWIQVKPSLLDGRQWRMQTYRQAQGGRPWF